MKDEKQGQNKSPEAVNYDRVLCTGLNNAAEQIHLAAKEKGFWDKEREVGTLLMLCVSELSEALEADRHGFFTDYESFENALGEEEMMEGRISDRFFKNVFQVSIKDTFEDEIADTIIRILDLCGARGIDIEKHINLKLRYNEARERMHGKGY